jgi:serine/threonine protein kinase
MDKKEIREQYLSAQVRREIYIMRSLSYKHTVRMCEVLTSNTKLYIVMELVTGGLLYTQCGTPDYCASEIIERADEGYNGAKK